VDMAIAFLERPEWTSCFASQVTHRFPLDRANEALETVRDWRAGKTVILP